MDCHKGGSGLISQLHTEVRDALDDLAAIGYKVICEMVSQMFHSSSFRHLASWFAILIFFLRFILVGLATDDYNYSYVTHKI